MSDRAADRFPVSIKGVIIRGEDILLLKNERDEWELPGGKLEPGEVPTDCIVREIEEELSITTIVETILDSWLYHVNKTDVLIVTYLMIEPACTEPILSDEHKQLGFFKPSRIAALPMPDGYKQSIKHALQIRNKQLPGNI